MGKMRQGNRAALLIITFALGGCFDPSSTKKSVSSSLGTGTPAGGPKAARFYLKVSNTDGSFDAAPTAGTSNQPGLGHAAVRVFNADGSLLASGGPTASNWPKWISRFEVTVSGTANSASLNPRCARFADNSDVNSRCDFNGDGNFDSACGAPLGSYRVSEWDCADPTSPTLKGNGGGSDGVAIRVDLNRDPLALASFENILMIVEYSASALNRTPSDPTLCFSNGKIDPTHPLCSDQSWQVFLKHSPTELVQPYVTLIPPQLGFVDPSRNLSGSSVSTKQFYIPLGGDSALREVQISRIQGLPQNFPGFTSTCRDPASGVGNSALCVGAVIQSILFLRM